MNCQPISTAKMTPSSTTRFVEAISKAMAAVKLAPFRKSDRARATAAYEQDDEAIPNAVARARVRGRSSPSRLTIVLRRTTAWMIGREHEAEDQGPENLPGHRPGRGQGMPEPVENPHA